VARALRGAARAVPEEIEATVAVDYQIGEDRLREARVIDADLMIFAAALAGGLGPSGAEFDIAGVEAEGGCALALAFDRLEGRLGVEGQGLDCALEEAVLGQREGADRRHFEISICLELQVRIHRGPDGDRKTGGEATGTRPGSPLRAAQWGGQSGRNAVEDGTDGEICFAMQRRGCPAGGNFFGWPVARSKRGCTAAGLRSDPPITDERDCASISGQVVKHYGA